MRKPLHDSRRANGCHNFLQLMGNSGQLPRWCVCMYHYVSIFFAKLVQFCITLPRRGCPDAPKDCSYARKGVYKTNWSHVRPMLAACVRRQRKGMRMGYENESSLLQ
jgi:hypothetical protein